MAEELEDAVFTKYVACRGYHVYNSGIWEAEEQYVGKEVFVAAETSPESIERDPYCCAIQISRAGRLHNLTIGHIPREISRFVFFFLHHGGSVDGKVIDLNRRYDITTSGTTYRRNRFLWRRRDWEKCSSPGIAIFNAYILIVSSQLCVCFKSIIIKIRCFTCPIIWLTFDL